MLAAQDEVVTIPRTLGLKHMDAKIGGMDIDRLRRWYRQGTLSQSCGLSTVRFPATPTPAAITKLVRRGILHNERFAVAVLVYGDKQDVGASFAGMHCSLHCSSCADEEFHRHRLPWALRI